jgi:hypothetical protein
MKDVILILIFTCVSCCGETFFKKKVENWTVPKKFEGEFVVSPTRNITIKYLKGEVFIGSSEGGILFNGSEIIASSPLLSEGFVVIPLYREIKGGHRYYGILLCAQSKVGTTAKIINLNSFGENMNSNEGMYFVLNTTGKFEWPNLSLYVSRFADKENEGVWVAALDLSKSE